MNPAMTADRSMLLLSILNEDRATVLAALRTLPLDVQGRVYVATPEAEPEAAKETEGATDAA